MQFSRDSRPFAPTRGPSCSGTIEGASYLTSLISKREQQHYPVRDKVPISEMIRECLANVREQECSAVNPLNPLEFWANQLHGKWKDVAQLSLELLAIPATSCPVERVFSQAGFATARHRNRTQMNLINAQLMCYLNS